MNDFVILCKSYVGDVIRAQRLAQSLTRYNRDQIPVYFCVPSTAIALFEDTLRGIGTNFHIISDESVVLSNPRVSLDHYTQWDGRLSQQVVKSEFWRYICARDNRVDVNYLCIDSESEFIRDFHTVDFIHVDRAPFTVMHSNESLLTLAEKKGIKKIGDNFRKDCAIMKEVFHREGPDYAFAPTPVIWSSKVWRQLDELYFKPRGITIWEAINERPNELHWYGEALLHYGSIALHPRGPLFRVYHYDWEYFSALAAGETAEALRGQYLGILKQSNWDYELDAGDAAKRKSLPSRILRSAKRFLARYR